jgi:hypothetical protein
MNQTDPNDLIARRSAVKGAGVLVAGLGAPAAVAV